MFQMNEVWVNWAEGAEHAYNVYYPFEWKEDDRLERLLFVPALHVTPLFFDYVENGLHELPDALFVDLEDERNPHCFILSDGVRSLVIDTLGYSVPIRKSRMRFEEEETLLRFIPYEPIRDYVFYPPPENDTLFTLLPIHMLGLTREEREKKQLLLEALYALKQDKKAKILYYYIEFDHTQYKKSKNLKKAELYQEFVRAVKTGWTERHEELLALFLKENEELRLLYDVRV